MDDKNGNTNEDWTWAVPIGFYTNPEVLRRICKERDRQALLASPPIFNSENFGTDQENKNVTEKSGEILRYNTGKYQLSYILQFGKAIWFVCDVMTRGAIKYARNNWKGGGANASLEALMDSSLRHVELRLNGEIYDPDMDTDHLANAACGLMFALYHHGHAPRTTVEEYRQKLEASRAKKD